MKLETKNFYKTVGALVLPIALQNLINVAVTSADVVMLGKVGETVLSGSSLAGQVQFILTLFFFGLTSGAAVLTAQYWGKKDLRTIEKVMGIAFRFSIIVAVLFILAVQIFPAQVMSIFTPEQPVIDEGVKYLRIVSFSYLTCAITHVYLNVMRSVERVVIATVTYSVSLVVNIIINWVLIFGVLGFPKLGIVGAAIGTLIARIMELLIVVFYAKTKSILTFRLKDLFVRDKLLFQDFMRYAIPVTLNELMWGTGCSVIAVVIGHMGQAAVAANSVAQVTRQLATVVSFGIAAAAAVLIGKAIGEDNYEEAQKYGTRFVKLSLVAGGAHRQAYRSTGHVPDPHGPWLSVHHDVYYGVFRDRPGLQHHHGGGHFPGGRGYPVRPGAGCSHHVGLFHFTGRRGGVCVPLERGMGVCAAAER